jgi:hypothetical protein
MKTKMNSTNRKMTTSSLSARVLAVGLGSMLVALAAAGCDHGESGGAPPPVVTPYGNGQDTLTLSVSPAGAGTAVIFADPISIGGAVREMRGTDATLDCAKTGDQMILWAAAEAAPGFIFDHWEGKCTGTGDEYAVNFPVCDGTLYAYTCTAVFTALPAPVVDGPAGPTGPTLSLKGDWAFNQDANQNSPAPAMTVDAQSDQSVTVSYEGATGDKCDCNAEHLVIPLGKSFDCSSATMEFDYAAGGSFGPTSTASLSIRFCQNGKCDEGGFYGNDQFLGSEQAGHSNCAIPFANSFPAAPQLVQGHNKVSLGKLEASMNGKCGSSFDTIDVHMQGYACFKTDLGSATLSNLRIY